MMNKVWEVIVGNIGTVYSGLNELEAREIYQQYCKDSTEYVGRASRENVTLMCDNEIVVELIYCED